MLLFYCADDASKVATASQQGLEASGSEYVLHPTLEAAKQAGSGPVLIVDPTKLRTPSRDALGEEPMRVSSLPPEALCNVDPYRPPRPVTAGGGYVGCALSESVGLLLIYRRGVWDLPKGTQDPGESIVACAQREVREEVGVERLDVLRSLATTQHAYPDGEGYAVKTTHWYLMCTPERTFEPGAHEGIERVAWARWEVARQHIGYDTLARHMDRIEPAVRAALT